MLSNTKSKAPRITKVLLLQLVLLHLQGTVKDFLGFESSHSNMHSNLLISTNAESTNSVASYQARIIKTKTGQVERKVYLWNRRASCRSAAPTTFAARVSLSPDSPTEQLMTILSIFSSRITLAFFASAILSVYSSREIMHRSQALLFLIFAFFPVTEILRLGFGGRDLEVSMEGSAPLVGDLKRTSLSVRLFFCVFLLFF